ncbi:MAG: KH domain-containing protein [Actinobacteria bacterium]|nr:KH domain-containing protein [Actinomycetota bacterium]
MAQTHEDVAGLVDMLVRSLVTDEDAVKIDSSEEGDTLRLDISVSEEEVGKVIGRQGRVIKAIRTLARAAASQAGFSVEVEISD